MNNPLPLPLEFVAVVLLVMFFSRGRLKTSRRHIGQPTQTPPRPQENPAPQGGVATVITESLPLPSIMWYEVWKKKWWEENELVILIAFPLIHLALYARYPDWWLERFSNLGIWVLQGVLLLFLWMIPRGTGPIHRKLGWIGGVFTGLLILTYLVQGSESSGEMSGGVSQFPSSAGTPNTRNNILFVLPKQDPEVLKLEEQFFAEYPWMKSIAGLETNHNQYEWTDGKPDPTRLLHAFHNEKETAVGVMQIKTDVWGKFCEDRHWDITVTEGNLGCAVAIYEEHGLEPWRQPGRKLEFDEVIASTDWSKPLRISPTISVKGPFDHDVAERFDGNDQTIVIDGPGKNPKVNGIKKSIDFHTLQEGEVATAHLVLTFL